MTCSPLSTKTLHLCAVHHLLPLTCGERRLHPNLKRRTLFVWCHRTGTDKSFSNTGANRGIRCLLKKANHVHAQQYIELCACYALWLSEERSSFALIPVHAPGLPCVPHAHWTSSGQERSPPPDSERSRRGPNRTKYGV